MAASTTGFVSYYHTVEMKAANADNVIAVKCIQKGGGQYIDLTNREIKQMDIFDATGKRIIRLKGQNHGSLNSYPKGIYLIKVLTDKNVSTSKVIYKD